MSNCEFVAVKRDAVEWLKKHYPALCEKSGLCERIGGRLYTVSTIAPELEEPHSMGPFRPAMLVNTVTKTQLREAFEDLAERSRNVNKGEG